MKKSPARKPAVVSPKKWLTARLALLRQEKAFDRLRDRLSARRRKLPWVKVDQNYVFTTPDGKKSLAELFAGRSQLIVYHFMLGPDWEEGCRGCSYVSDHFDGAVAHLGARDVTLTAVSRAPLRKISAFKQRMGWKFPWVSSHGSDFNHDYHVSFTPQEMASGKVYYNYGLREVGMEEMPGLSVFARDKPGAVYHTYSTYSRGLDLLIGTYNLLDLVPKGRDEDRLERSMQWVRHHDRYESPAAAR
jgi:predicted dithiol-disulfide oxidoreductase (DUF899 family)